MGVKQVAEIDAQMLAIAKQQGFADLKSFNEHIRQDPKLHGKSGQQILDLYQHYTDQMYTKLPQLFGRLPKNKLDVVPMEAFRAPDSVPPPITRREPADGSRPGRINVNEYDPEHRLLLNARGHRVSRRRARASPGVFHFVRADRHPAIPQVQLHSLRTRKAGRSTRSAWAKTSASTRTPTANTGGWQNEMWRSIRLVVDTGVHYKHWTREQMVDYFRAHTAMDEPNIQTEVDRYIAWPGQALSYKLGQMEILALREQAKKELGAKYDIKSFHDEVLSAGPLPLDVLHTRVTVWIAKQK